MKTPLAAALLLGMTLLTPTAESQPAAERRSERPDPPAVETIRGEAVVRSDEVELVIAIDEADAEGNVDGKVDHLLYMPVMDLIPVQLSLRDPAAEIQVRRLSVRALLPTLGKDLSFHMVDTREFLPEALDMGAVLRLQRYTEALHLTAYQGQEVNELTLQEVERVGPAVVKMVRPPVEVDIAKITIDPLKPTPSPEAGGSGCKDTCSISCGTGSCSAACVPGHCAKCKCIDLTPSCYCI